LGDISVDKIMDKITLEIAKDSIESSY